MPILSLLSFRKLPGFQEFCTRNEDEDHLDEDQTILYTI